GSYTIPAGNLFPEGTEGTRPEIYTMGHRNPFRINVDKHTGYVYWGDVGPDAGEPDSTRGPAGHDEVGQAREPGNFGWPHFVGNNKAYHKYDFAAQSAGEEWDAAAPTNNSPNNTGLRELPPAREAFIWYPYGQSPDFPLVGNGGRNAMAGPVYYREDFNGAERAWPAYYDGKFLAYEWMRGWIMSVTMDDEGNLTNMERFMPNYKFSNPMDMQFADNGDLYMLEYGSGWFSQNEDARLIRIEYNGGNRSPQAIASVDQRGGTLPLTVNLAAEDVTDPDADELSYEWIVESDRGFKETLEGENVKLTLEDAGSYQATLRVTDGNGGEATSAVNISAGNSLPDVQLQLVDGNRSFYTPGQPIQYMVLVNDEEDGSLDNGITASQVALTVDYLAEGFDQVEIARGHRGADEGAMAGRGESLINESDCISCHAVAKESVGPTYQAVAARYASEAGSRDYLIGKIIAGGGGVWGENVMSAHPDLSEEQAGLMVDYILALDNGEEKDKMPLAGSFTPEVPEGDAGVGVYFLRAAYQDKGATGLPPTMSEDLVVLRNANVGVHSYDVEDKVQKFTYQGNKLLIAEENGAYVMLRDVDLANIKSLTVMATAPQPTVGAVGGTVELRIDGADGPLLGTSDPVLPAESMSLQPSMLNIPIELPQGAADSSHDIYLVFVNEETSDKTIMVVMGTQFQLAGAQMSR
ncbi:MAG: PKD domain-containing protein, partial [Lewinella sp.]